VLLTLSYGVLGGIGLGLGYIVPLGHVDQVVSRQTAALITGITVEIWCGRAHHRARCRAFARVVWGFGSFTVLGIAYFILVSSSPVFMKKSPSKLSPGRWNPPLQTATATWPAMDYTLGAAPQDWQWYGL